MLLGECGGPNADLLTDTMVLHKGLHPLSSLHYHSHQFTPDFTPFTQVDEHSGMLVATKDLSKADLQVLVP